MNRPLIFVLQKVWLFVAAELSMACIAAAAGPQIETSEIKIGAILHLTGDVAMQSAAFREGMELALDEINASEGGSKRIALEVEDGKNEAQASNTAARKLLNDGVKAVIVSSYLDAMSDGPMFEHAKIPGLVIWDSNEEIDALGEYIFAIGPSTQGSGEQPAKLAIDDLHAKSAVIFSNQDPYSDEAANFFSRYFMAHGGKILDRYLFGPADSDMRAVLSKVKSLKPDFVYAPLVNNVLAFFKQYKEQHIPSPIFAADTISTQVIEDEPEIFEGVYQTHIRAPDSAALERLRASYQKRFGVPLKMDWFVAVGYDSVEMIASAIKRGAKTGSEIKDELYKVVDFPGASAKLSISPAGSAPVIESIYRIHEGKLVFLRE